MLRRLFFQVVVISSLVGCGFIKPERPVGPIVELDPELEGRGKLVDAIVSKDIPRIERLIREGVSVNPPANCIWLNHHLPRPSGKASPLVMAIISTGDIGIVRMLVSAGADTNADTCSNPLVRAIRESADREGQIEIVRYLIEHGADVNKFEDGETTPLRMALRHATKWETNYELVVLLVEHGANVNQAAVPEPFDISSAISSVFRPTCSNNYSGLHTTPLHEAVFILRLDISKYLLDRGANPKAKDGRGMTPRDCARQRINVIRAFYKNKPQLESHSQSMLQGIEAQILLLLQYEQKHKL